MVMKTHLPILAGAFLLLGLAPSVGAQIRDNESSANALAIQCAVSSGFSALDYGDYCRRLAKTIGKLNSEQQTRVFGYLPMPGGGLPERGRRGRCDGLPGQSPPGRCRGRNVRG